MTFLLILGQHILDNGQHNHEDGKYNRHGRGQTHLPVHRTGFVNVIYNRVGGVVGTAAGHNHRLNQHTERTDCHRDKHKYTQGFQLRQRDIAEFLPLGCVVHLSRFIQGRVDILKSAQENNHLIPNALPYTHNGDGWQRLIGAVNKCLRINAEIGKQRI